MRNMSAQALDVTLFPDRLREALGQAQMKPIKLAQAMSVSRSTVSRWLNKGGLPSRSDYSKIAAVLGCDEAWLAGVKEIATRPDGLVRLAAAAALTKVARETQNKVVAQGMSAYIPVAGGELVAVPVLGVGELGIPIDSVPKPKRHEIRSMVSERLKKLTGREVMMLRLEGGATINLHPGDGLSVREVRGGGGGPHIIVFEVVMAREMPVPGTAAGGAHAQRAPIGRTSGRPRNIRRKPELGKPPHHDEDDDEAQEG